MNKISSNGLNYIQLNSSSVYLIRTTIVKIIQTYFTPDINNTWTIVDSMNTLIKDGGTEEEIDESAEGYQTLQCPWDKNFQIKIGNSKNSNGISVIYITFHDYSSGELIYSSYDLMNSSMYTCKIKDPLYFNFIVSKTKKSFAFSCSNDYSPFMQHLCLTSNKNKMGVFWLLETSGMDTLNPTVLLYNGKRHSFNAADKASTSFIYRTFPIINNKNTIILPCLEDSTGDVFPEAYHLISTSVNEDTEIAKAVFKINNSIYHGVVKQIGNSSFPDNYWISGPFLLQIE